MNKTENTKFTRYFLFEALPEPLTPASWHLQFFDNYIAETRLRLRVVRDPATKEWTRSFQQINWENGNGVDLCEVREIVLNEYEYTVLETFEGREIRKNRYFYEFGGKQISLDIYLGSLWGINRGKIDFDSAEEMRSFELPDFSVAEITGIPALRDENIVDRSFEEFKELLGSFFPDN